MLGQDCVDGEVNLGWGDCNDFYSGHSNGCMSSGCYNIDETTVLELPNSGLTGEIPPEIGNLINLTSLNLFSNELTGEIPVEIGNLTNLTILGLMDNQLTGNIPHEIGNLFYLTYLNLYSNQLTGNIPSNIGNLGFLWYLDLQMNQLTGNIPSEIGNLVHLTTLRLNDNNLSGVIPGNICDLTIDWTGGVDLVHETPLLYFDVGNNNFCPPYPDCINNPEPFTDVNNNGIWDIGEPFEDINESGYYDENQIGYQDTSECFNPGNECLIGDYTGYYDCDQNCVDQVYYDEWLGDGFCDDSNVSFNCDDFGYDCGDCSEDWDGTDPLGFCSCPSIPGDINNDNIIDILDVIMIVNCILSDSCDECSDINGDEMIDILDIVEMVNIIMDN